MSLTPWDTPSFKSDRKEPLKNEDYESKQQMALLSEANPYY